MKNRSFLCVVMLVFLLVGGSLHAQSPEEKAPEKKEKNRPWWLKKRWDAGNGFEYRVREDPPGPYSYAATSEKDYSGITLTILCPSSLINGHCVRLHAQQFEELTGAKISVHYADYDQLYGKAVWGLIQNNKFDIVVYNSTWLPDFVDVLAPVPQEMLDSPQMKDTLPHYLEVAKWEGVVYHVPVDGDRHYQIYRKDVFEDKNHQKDFLKAYRYPLEAPRTWKEYTRVIEFFKTRKQRNGTPISGGVESTKRDLFPPYQLLKRAAPYTNHPDVKLGRYFEVETMKPLINTPGFVAALEDWVAAFQHYSPKLQNMGMADAWRYFAHGNAATMDSWDDVMALATERKSPTRKLIATTLSPGSKRVWNLQTNEWNEFPAINYSPYAVWGFTTAVSKACKNKKAAFDYLGFFGNPANHRKDLLIGHFGVNPCRESDLETSYWIKKARMKSSLAASYVNTLRTVADSKNKSLGLIIYRSSQYMSELERQIRRAMIGQKTAQQALDDVATEWERINAQVGIDRQRRAYLNMIRMEQGLK